MGRMEVVALLQKIVKNEENELIQAQKNHDTIIRQLILFELIRAFDFFFTSENSDEERSFDYDFGLNEAIRILYGKYTNTPKFPLTSSKKELWNYAHSVIHHCSKIAVCKRTITFLKANMADGEVRGKEIIVHFGDNAGYVEEAERNDASGIRSFMEKNFSKPRIDDIESKKETVKKLLGEEVKIWKKEFIQYDTTPEIDEYFYRLAEQHLRYDVGHSEFSPNSEFGGIPYGLYCDFVTVNYSVVLKHFYFCMELLQKEKDLHPANLLTIPRDRDKMIQTDAECFEIPLAEAEQIIDCLTLSNENYEYHTKKGCRFSAPLIQLAKNSLAFSLAGSARRPFDFLNRELKRRFPKDYFRAVNNREEILQRLLYSLFEGEQYLIRLAKFNVKTSLGPTDIDAAIYDTRNDVLGLFQLKWQDMFGSSLKERYSRISNLFPNVAKWLDKVTVWLDETDEQELLNVLHLNVNKVPAHIRLFVICQHMAFFTDQPPDERAAWSSFWGILAAQRDNPPNPNDKINHLYNVLKEREKKIFNSGYKEQSEEKIAISGYDLIIRRKGRNN